MSVALHIAASVFGFFRRAKLPCARTRRFLSDILRAAYFWQVGLAQSAKERTNDDLQAVRYLDEIISVWLSVIRSAACQPSAPCRLLRRCGRNKVYA